MTKYSTFQKIILGTRAFIILFVWMIVSIPDTPEQIAANEKAAQQENMEAHLIDMAVSTVRDSLRNRNSLDIHQAMITEDNIVCLTYSAQNGFGGMNMEQTALRTGLVVKYGKYCDGKTGVDKTSLARFY